METISKFKANDGTEWRTEEKCLAYEQLGEQVAAIMGKWPEHPKDDGCNFSNGHGYFQLTPELVLSTRNALLDLAAEHCDHKWVKEARADATIHLSWPLRILDEDNFVRPIVKAMYRLYATDDKSREWGQPYYGSHPDEGEAIELGKAPAA